MINTNDNNDSSSLKGGFTMIIVTTEKIEGYQIKEIKGACFGLVVRSRGFAGQVTAAFRSLAGGEIKEYTEMLEDARKQAMDRLTKNAQAMGANAVIMFRYDSGEIGQNMSEIVAYGTAVVVEQVK
jgi:uncharacterized protein YbjQ (UPF0145 family)